MRKLELVERRSEGCSTVHGGVSRDRRSREKLQGNVQ